jgi:hypothetical protein
MAPGFFWKIRVTRIDDLNPRPFNPFGTHRVAHAIESQTEYIQAGPHVAHAAGSEGGRR